MISETSEVAPSWQYPHGTLRHWRGGVPGGALQTLADHLLPRSHDRFCSLRVGRPARHPGHPARTAPALALRGLTDGGPVSLSGDEGLVPSEGWDGLIPYNGTCAAKRTPLIERILPIPLPHLADSLLTRSRSPLRGYAGFSELHDLASLRSLNSAILELTPPSQTRHQVADPAVFGAGYRRWLGVIA